VHLGLGDRALSISEHALDRSMAMGADGSESRITLALALCQVGRADEALAVLDVVENVTPYMLSVRALARAITGDPSGSIDDADLVAADAGASYLDRVIAGTSAGAAAMQLGQRDDSLSRFDDASSTARETGDVVARELVGLTRSLVLREPSHQEAGHLGSGWRSVAVSLAALVVDRPGEPVA
jgi:hypothetical protein